MKFRIKNPKIIKKVITVKVLKQILSEIPNFDANGEETEVYISTEEGKSSIVNCASALNYRDNGKLQWCDLLLESV